MRPEPEKFKKKADAALKDDYLCSAMADNQAFAAMVRQAVNSEPHLDEMKQRARQIKTHTLDQLAHYLEQYEKKGTVKRHCGPLGPDRGPGPHGYPADL